MHYGNRFDGKGKREREREKLACSGNMSNIVRGEKKQQRAREVAKVLIQVATKNRMDYLRGKHTFRCLKGSICGDQQLHGIQKMTD